MAAKTAERMDSTIIALQKELAGLRTGRASAGLLDQVTVECYGNQSPISQVATINIPEARTLTIQPWDISNLAMIEKAIQNSDLGITPQNDGKIIRLNLPPMTEERRKDLAKIAKKVAEEHKIAIRNIRRDANDASKKQLKDKEISEDEHKGHEAEIQKITDGFISKIDSVVAAKEKEILES